MRETNFDSDTLQDLVDAMPRAEAAYSGVIQQLLKNHPLGRHAGPQPSFLRSMVTEGEASAAFAPSKGAIHTLDDNLERPVDTLSDVNEADLAVLTAHEVIIRRLAVNPSGFSRLPYEHSTTHREYEAKPPVFSNIDSAAQHVSNAAKNGAMLSNMNEPYQQGMLSIVQTYSMFPDIARCFREGNRDGFIAMVEKVAKIWPAAGWHGPLAQTDHVFHTNLLSLQDDGEVLVDESFAEDIAQLSGRAAPKPRLDGIETALYESKTGTVTFKPHSLPNDINDSRDIPGSLVAYSHRTDEIPSSHGKCPALRRADKNEPSLIARMAATLYDQAKSLEPNIREVLKDNAQLVELDAQTILKLVDYQSFRDKIPEAERKSWDDDETGQNMIDNGTAYTSAEFQSVYLDETVLPLLRDIGRAGIKRVLERPSYGINPLLLK